MVASNRMNLSSLKQQEDKHALTSYATKIVVPTTNRRRYVKVRNLSNNFEYISKCIYSYLRLCIDVEMHEFLLVLVTLLMTVMVNMQTLSES